jgi:DNA-binding beta-propeller fold protein YncE
MQNVVRLGKILAMAASVAAAIVVPMAVRAEALQFEYVASFGTQGLAEGQFEYVEDFAFTKAGELLVTDAGHAWVQAFNAKTGAFLARFGGKGEGDANLEKPEGIAVDGDGNVFVADYTTGFIVKYDADFKHVLTFSGYGAAKGQNMKSEFMEVSGDRLYMADAGNHRVDVFDVSGRSLFAFGGPGAEPGQLNSPEAAKIGKDGNIYVADLRNDRVQVFDPEGHFLRTWGKTGNGEGEFKSPSGLAIDRDGNVYVAEIGNDRVQVFDMHGTFLGKWGRKGSGQGEFGNLHGLAVDKASGLIYVADTANHRVQVFRAQSATQ